MISEYEFLVIGCLVRRFDDGRWDTKLLKKFITDVIQRTNHEVALRYFIEELRPQLQKRNYLWSKKKDYVDGIQLNILKIIALLERWWSPFYKSYERNEILRKNPELSKNPRKIKNEINDSWEKYLKKHSY